MMVRQEDRGPFLSRPHPTPFESTALRTAQRSKVFSVALCDELGGQHLTIVKAIEEREAGAAERAMKAHLQYVTTITETAVRPILG